MSLQLAQVVAVNSAKRTAEIVLMDTGARISDAVIAGGTSSDGGAWAVPSVKRPTAEKLAGGLPSTGRALIAVVALVGGRAIVLSFIRPPAGFGIAEQDRAIYQHPASGSFVTIAPDGSIEAYHGPSGACLRIGTGGHAAVPGAPAAAGGGAVPTITLSTPKFSAVVDPSGNAVVTCQGKLDATSVGDMSFTAPNITLNGNTLINGPLSQGTGSAGGTATLEGPVTIVNDLTANGTSVHTHRHGGVQIGVSNTGTPV